MSAKYKDLKKGHVFRFISNGKTRGAWALKFDAGHVYLDAGDSWEHRHSCEDPVEILGEPGCLEIGKGEP